MNDIVKPRKGLFLCSRMSCYGCKPCDEAVEVEIVNVDKRNKDDPKKIPAYLDKDDSWWYDNGTNHRVVNGFIQRDMGTRKEWVVETDNLLDFIDKNGGDVIITKHFDGFYEIKIYDSYAE